MLNKVQMDAIVQHFRHIANIFDIASKQPINNIVPDEVPKRGRKPGTVSDEVRCEHINGNYSRCKNRATKGKVCGKHLDE
jgi:hypothetical protein